MAQGTPESVERAEAESDKLLEEFEKAARGEAPSNLDSLAKETDEPTGEPESTPAKEPEKAPEAPDVEALRRQLEYEKHRNDSLQGRIDSQLRPLNDEVRRLREEQAYLRGKQEAQPAGVSAEPQKDSSLRHVTKEELESVGKDALDLQARVARGVAEGELEKLRRDAEAKQAALDARLREVEQERSAAQVRTLWDRVEKLSPGAASDNASDTGWFEFLNQPEPESGVLRRTIGENAVAVGDVRRLAMLHDEYRRVSGKTATPAATAPDVKPETVRVTPSSHTSGTAGTKVTIRESDIKRFYSDYARGAYRNREEEAKKLEARIERAVQEGRVIPG